MKKHFAFLYFLQYLIILIAIVGFLFYSNTKAIDLYEQAKQRAKQENKKILVLGSPYSASGKIITTFTKTYGCGDICIDMNGCGSCENQITDKAENVLHKFGSNEYVIFESGLLEVVDDKELDYIVNEMYRIAGSEKNIFGRHYIQNNKIFYRYVVKYIYSLLGEGTINRFVDEFPPNNKYKFEKI